VFVEGMFSVIVFFSSDIIFIIGDFNLPHIDYESFDSPEDQIHSVFLDFCLKSGLNEFVKILYCLTFN